MISFPVTNKVKALIRGEVCIGTSIFVVKEIEQLEIAHYEYRRQIKNAANMLRGMQLDPTIPEHAKSAMLSNIDELEAAIK